MKRIIIKSYINNSLTKVVKSLDLSKNKLYTMVHAGRNVDVITGDEEMSRALYNKLVNELGYPVNRLK